MTLRELRPGRWGRRWTWDKQRPQEESFTRPFELPDGTLAAISGPESVQRLWAKRGEAVGWRVEPRKKPGCFKILCNVTVDLSKVKWPFDFAHQPELFCSDDEGRSE